MTPPLPETETPWTEAPGTSGQRRKTMRMTSMIAVIAVILSHGGATYAQSAGCLAYEPQTVTLTGSVQRVMAYGPPNFGENPRTDAKEPYLALTLPTPVCVQGDPAQDDPEADVRVLQIAFVSIPFDRTIAGSKVRITGTLMHQMTGHHHTRVLILPTRIEKLAAVLEFSAPADRAAPVRVAEGVDLDEGPAPASTLGPPASAVAPMPQAPAQAAPDLGFAPPIAAQRAPALPTPGLRSAVPAAQARATAYAETYLAQWSAPNDQALAAMARSYAATVDFYGKPVPRAALLAQKRAYALRWPARSYIARPGSVVASCGADGNVCTVTGLVEWDCRSTERNAHAAGVAEFTITVVWGADGPGIVAESGAVLARTPSR